MKGVKLKISKPIDRLFTGSSKLFGDPDVWDGFEWPYIEENGEQYDLAFLCQINCAEVSPFDGDRALPQSGMLYFFYDLDTMPETSDERSARVLWYDGDISALSKMMLTDESGNSLTFCEQKIDFEEAKENDVSSYLLPKDVISDTVQDSDPTAGFVPILQLCSLETEDAQISFKSGGKLCFYIDPEGLKTRNFSRAKAVQTAR